MNFNLIYIRYKQINKAHTGVFKNTDQLSFNKIIDFFAVKLDQDPIYYEF